MAFQKGQSGNPGGRKKRSPELIEIETLARSYAPDAIRALAGWARQKRHAPAAVAACNAILDRGFGKPAQDMTVRASITNDISNVTDAQLAEIIAAGIGGDGGIEETDDKARLH